MATIDVRISEGINFSEETSLSNLEEYAEEIFLDTCEIVGNGPELSKNAVARFQDIVEEFIRLLREVSDIVDKDEKSKALRAIICATKLGYYHAGNDETLKAAESKFKKKNAEPANNARRKKCVNDAVRKHAYAACCIDPLLKNHTYVLAKQITQDVINDVSIASDRPSDWPKDPNVDSDLFIKITNRIYVYISHREFWSEE